MSSLVTQRLSYQVCEEGREAAMLHGALQQSSAMEGAAHTPLWQRRPPPMWSACLLCLPLGDPKLSEESGCPLTPQSWAATLPVWVLGKVSALVPQVDQRRLVCGCQNAPHEQLGLALTLPSLALWSPASGLSLHSMGFRGFSFLTSI